MLDTIDEEVRDWLKGIVKEAVISFSLPSDEVDKLVLFAYLFNIERPAALPPGRTPPMQLRVSYLITAAGPDPVAAHGLLGDAIAAASAQSQYALEFGSPNAEAWASINLPARASFVLRATATQKRDIKPSPLVVTPIVHSAPLERLVGQVVAADGTPLAGAVVEVPGLGRTTTANSEGRFVLEGVTASIDLTVRAQSKGREVEVQRAARTTDDFKIVIDVVAASTQN